jgi:hypothetical protein
VGEGDDGAETAESGERDFGRVLVAEGREVGLEMCEQLCLQRSARLTAGPSRPTLACECLGELASHDRGHGGDESVVAGNGAMLRYAVGFQQGTQSMGELRAEMLLAECGEQGVVEL